MSVSEFNLKKSKGEHHEPSTATVDVDVAETRRLRMLNYLLTSEKQHKAVENEIYLDIEQNLIKLLED